MVRVTPGAAAPDPSRPRPGRARILPEVRIRQATERDADAIAGILAEGLGDKYRPAFGRHTGAALAAIVRESRDRPPAGYRVAVDADDRPVAVAHLSLEPSIASIHDAVAREVGTLTALRASIVLMAFAKGRMGHDEAHLDELSVSPAARRQGIATALLEECAAVAAAAGKRRLTLWVTGDNTGARALYERTGFRVARRRAWFVGRLLFGSRGALQMERLLTLHP